MTTRVRDRLLDLTRGAAIEATTLDDYRPDGGGPTAAVVVETEAEADAVGRLYATGIGGPKLRADVQRAGVVIY